jgi:hypothetical protein
MNDKLAQAFLSGDEDASRYSWEVRGVCVCVLGLALPAHSLPHHLPARRAPVAAPLAWCAPRTPCGPSLTPCHLRRPPHPCPPKVRLVLEFCDRGSLRSLLDDEAGLRLPGAAGPALWLCARGRMARLGPPPHACLGCGQTAGVQRCSRDGSAAACMPDLCPSPAARSVPPQTAARTCWRQWASPWTWPRPCCTCTPPTWCVHPRAARARHLQRTPACHRRAAPLPCARPPNSTPPPPPPPPPPPQVHSDLKARNVLLKTACTDDGRGYVAKVADFGEPRLARPCGGGHGMGAWCRWLEPHSAPPARCPPFCRGPRLHFLTLPKNVLSLLRLAGLSLQLPDDFSHVSDTFQGTMVSHQQQGLSFRQLLEAQLCSCTSFMPMPTTLPLPRPALTLRRTWLRRS